MLTIRGALDESMFPASSRLRPRARVFRFARGSGASREAQSIYSDSMLHGLPDWENREIPVGPCDPDRPALRPVSLFASLRHQRVGPTMACFGPTRREPKCTTGADQATLGWFEDF